MRFQSLAIENFRAITHLELSNLNDTVVIAGPNGCGKSSIYDAIKMLKTAYGGYQPNEWQTLISEFQIDLSRKNQDLSVLLQDRTRPLRIMAEVTITAAERQHLRDNATELLSKLAIAETSPQNRWRNVLSVAATERTIGETVQEKVAEALPELLAELERETFVGALDIQPNGQAAAQESLALELIFSTYDSRNIGIIDYHGANRNYAKEQVATVNLNVQASEDKLRQHALYNYANKYTNLKTELASSYVRHLLTREGNPSGVVPDTLNATMKELFDTFFPGKTFKGPLPTPDGRLAFPVTTASGAEHDIDDLSSGEKEVLYGYLRIMNAAPEHSVLLIDEPELHLNPRLVKGLASFYHRHLGQALGNQLWLVTHSDALIREAVGQPQFSTFHMQPAGQYSGENQVSEVTAGQALERVIMDLVGDLAAYRPNAKIVLFEGEGDREFDVRMTCDLFPEFEAAVNAISVGNKARVSQLYSLLDKAGQNGHLAARFYAITDLDGDTSRSPTPNQHKWDVYHIENYLLSPTHILRVLQEIHKTTASLNTEPAVMALLTEAAKKTVPTLIAHELRAYANRELLACLDFGFSPDRADVAVALAEAVERARAKVAAAQIGKEILVRREAEIASEADDALRDGRWRSTFRGRDVLRRFCDQARLGIPYEIFRDLIIARMRESKHEPAGMKQVIDKILSDK